MLVSFDIKLIRRDQKQRNNGDACWASLTCFWSSLITLLSRDTHMVFYSYRKNSKNSDTLNYHRDCPTNGIVAFYSAILHLKDSDRITNRVDTDQTAP